MFITIEGIKGSGRNVVAAKLADEFAVLKDVEVSRVDVPSDSFGTALDAAVIVSDVVLSTPSDKVCIATEYLDSMFAYYKIGRGSLSLRQELVMFNAIARDWCFTMPHITIHIDTSVAKARKKIMALNARELDTKCDEAFCSNWDKRNAHVKNKFALLRAVDKDNRITLIDTELPQEEKWKEITNAVFR